MKRSSQPLLRVSYLYTGNMNGRHREPGLSTIPSIHPSFLPSITLTCPGPVLSDLTEKGKRAVIPQAVRNTKKAHQERCVYQVEKEKWYQSREIVA